MSYICPNCKRELLENYKYCPSCGEKADYNYFCPKCGNPYKYIHSYCIKCGNELKHDIVEKKTNDKWKLFPVSIILYLTILVVHLVFLLIFREKMVDNMAFVSIFDSVMIIVWSCFPVYKTIEILKFKYDFKWWHPFTFIGAVAFGFFFALYFVKFLQWFLELESQSFVKKLMKSGYSLLSVVLMVCVQPAIIEELAFRGIVFRALEKALNTKETILISAFLFAMLHLSLVSMPHLMMLGIFFGYIRYKTGSIWPSVIAHFIHNFSAVMVDYYQLF